jgi:predicted nucleic acid-binding protein
MIAFDANVLVYAVDGLAGARHERARAVLASAFRAGSALLPLQVLAEFYNVATRKMRLPPAQARDFIASWTALCHIESYLLEDMEEAMTAHAEHGLAFWDALIWAVCERAGVRTLASEDFQNGRTLGRVIFLDPFDPANDARLGLT